MEKELYELTPSQDLILFALKYIYFPQFINLAGEVQIESEIDINKLIEAANVAASRNPNNKVRLIKKKGKVYQYFSDEPINKIEYKEFNDEDAYNQQLKEIVGKPFKNKGIGMQLFRFMIVKKPNGKYALVGCFSHLVYDAYSVMAFFKEVISVYESMINNAPLPDAPLSPIEAYKLDYAYLKSNKYLNDKKYADEVLYKTEPKYTCLIGEKSKTYLKHLRVGLADAPFVSLSYEGGMIDIPLERKFTDMIDEYAVNNKVSPQALYFLAIRTYLGSQCKTDDVEVINLVNRRLTLQQKKCGGALEQALYVRTIFDNNCSFLEGINKVNNATYEMYKHCNFPITNTQNVAQKKFLFKTPITTYASFYLTYQARINLSSSVKYTFRRLTSGKELQNIYMTVMPYNSENDYVANYTYMKDTVSEDEVRKFHQFMIDFVNEGIKNDGQSINDIMKKVGR